MWGFQCEKKMTFELRPEWEEGTRVQDVQQEFQAQESAAAKAPVARVHEHQG